MSRFFVDRPIVAIVIAVHRGSGGVARRPPVAQSRHHSHPRSRARRPTRGRRRDDRAVVAQPSPADAREKRCLHATNANAGTMTLTVTFDIDSDVQHRPGQRPEPRVAGPAHSRPKSTSRSASRPQQQGLPIVSNALTRPRRLRRAFLGKNALINVEDALYRVPESASRKFGRPNTRCASG